MARLVSVNVGLPRDIEWQGRTVRTAIWKAPVEGRCAVRRLNLAGDGQGDLAGHGGEQRAVFVYQLESFRYWQERLQRTDLVPGNFGENLTVEGLPDDEVCIGDRFQIGTAFFEVTQPRVTCYRIGIRMNEPRMAALLTASGRPGFYLRVLKEGEVGAGDEIVKVAEANEPMTVAEVNALLYSPGHAPDRLERALRLAALSPGWRASFEQLLRTGAVDSGNAALVPAEASHPAPAGFRTLIVAAREEESADVVSFVLESADGRGLSAALPGQYVVLRLRQASGAPFFRSYSLSGAPSTERYRISVKLEKGGAAGAYLGTGARVGDQLDVSAPRGGFVLEQTQRPIVLLSAGIGATPVLAMLHALAAEGSTRQVLWIHGARDRRHHAFTAEVRGLVGGLEHGRSRVLYSKPSVTDKLGEDFDAVGHVSRAVLEELGISSEAEVYVCGPNGFMAEMGRALLELGVARDRIHVETFVGSIGSTPGVVSGPAQAPHVPAGDAVDGPLVSFSRSGIAAHFAPTKYKSVLELAEACGVPVRWSCRTGVCHSCESGLVSGEVAYDPAPLEAPAAGNLLVCCSQPKGDLVIDL